MTEEIIKECKNCDALGIDSEIGVYYCCLSHRQDDLPKEFTCNDFTPNKQLKRLEQENKALYVLKNSLCKMIDEDSEKIKELEQKYTEVLELAKTNADSNEYCLQELEKENEELKEDLKAQQMTNLKQQEIALDYWNALEEIREIAENAKENRYVTKSEDYTEGMHTIGCYILNKIKEVSK